MGSFFFTPIYMLLLVFVVMFGPRKGLKVVYAPFWAFKPYVEVCFALARLPDARRLSS